MTEDINEAFKNFIKHMPGAIYWKDINGYYLACSDYLLRESNFKDESDVVGKTDYELFPGRLANKLRKNDLKVIETGLELIAEEFIILPNKDRKFFQVIKTPLKDKNGIVIGILGNSVDITDRKRAEKLQIEKETAEKVSKAVEMMSGCIAHELRTPLAVIGINIDNLKIEVKNFFTGRDKLDSSEAKQKNKIEDFIKNTKLAIYSANSIITMLLVKLRTVLNRQVDNKNLESNLIKHCISEAVNEYPFYNNEREIVVWGDKSEKDFTYMGNDLLTKHILFNLIKNTLRAIKEAGRGKIYISLRQGENFNYLIFRDTASGIPAKVLETLFHQFNSGNKEGTGLGLAFCKMTMQSYGGDITCNSKEGEYTEFTLSFPTLTKGLRTKKFI
ncbi:MAG: Sensor protein [uncultured bacterium]|nr:MAG: Sensor protein [uncultured bacterium]